MFIMQVSTCVLSGKLVADNFCFLPLFFGGSWKALALGAQAAEKVFVYVIFCLWWGGLI